MFDKEIYAIVCLCESDGEYIEVFAYHKYPEERVN